MGMARTYDGHGAWLVNSEGHVYELGDARSYGSLSSAKAAQAPITSMASTPDGHGYWLLAASGQVYGFGDAHLQGMPNSYSAPYDAIVARPAGGYIVTGADDAENYTPTRGVWSWEGGLATRCRPPWWVGRPRLRAMAPG